jgi:large subunit ribosomal protein L22
MQTEKFEAKAVEKNARVSWKDCTEIGRYIKNDELETAENKLQQVVEKNQPVEYTKFDSDVGHKPGKGKARYPVKAAKKILEVLNLAKHNAKNQGLNENNLRVQNVITNQAQEYSTPKRHRGRSFKAAHIKIKVKEQ